MDKYIDEYSESAASYCWLVDGLGIGAPDAPIEREWARVRDRMRRSNEQMVVFATDWISDPWLARGTRNDGIGGIAPAWDPPDTLNAWPTFGVAEHLREIGVAARETRSDVLARRLAVPAAAISVNPESAVAEFVESEHLIRRHGDARMVFGDQVRAWLLAVGGPLLRGLLLTAGVDEEVIAQHTTHRLVLPRAIGLPDMWLLADAFGEKRIELLLNVAMQADGTLAEFDPVDLRVGQGIPWQQSWGWLSETVDADLVRDAVRLAARLLRNAGVREGVARALRSRKEAERTVAVAVVRRWTLALQAMTWLEDALSAPWRDVRPADLACAAFASVKPEWPRRLLAISHRSAEVKPVLRGLHLWKSARCAIDATYLPAWETNTGMIWGLFGATPSIVRVDTPTYTASEWCRRESELIEYLAGTADYLRGRLVIDTDLEGLDGLAELADRWHPDRPTQWIMPEFPPLLQVWTPQPVPPWEATILRAAGALRAMSASVHDPDLVNMIVGALTKDVEVPIPPPTNHPGGWAAYARIFRELHALVPDPAPALSLPAEYGPEQVGKDVEVCSRIPDLSTGSPSLDDVLVAVEFLRTSWPTMVEEGRGRFLALNLRGHTSRSFADATDMSLQRGLVAFRSLPVPLWLLQLAGQDASSWGLPGDRPILTEHVDAQFGWLMETWHDPGEARAMYPGDSGLAVSPALRRLLGAPA